MIGSLFAVWLKCFILSLAVSVIYMIMINLDDDVKQFITDYGAVKGVLYFFFITFLLGFGMSLLAIIWLFIIATIYGFVMFIF